MKNVSQYASLSSKISNYETDDAGSEVSFILSSLGFIESPYVWNVLVWPNT